MDYNSNYLQRCYPVFHREFTKDSNVYKSKSSFELEYLLVLQEKRNYSFFAVTNIGFMQLMMFLGNDLIEAVPLEDANIPKPGYVGSFKRNLKEKYNELIRQFATPPEFLVIESNPVIPNSK